jgi:hypothetical protein
LFKKYLFTVILISLFLFTSGCDVFNQAVQNAIEQTQTISAKTEGLSKGNNSAENTTSTPRPVDFGLLRPTVTKTSNSKGNQIERASEVTIDLAGQSIEVCGKVTFYGEENCPECINGYYSYLILDDTFYIISYEWTFSTNWIGSYFIAKDKIEIMGSKPIFVYGGSEGWDGSECEIMPDGTLSCDVGNYFKFVSNCEY